MTVQRFAYCCVATVILIGLPWVAVSAEAGSSAADGAATESGCTAFARCWDGSRVSCVGVSTCTAQDRVCPEIRGWVSCDGSKTYCERCKGTDSECPEAGLQCVTDSDCFPPPTQLGCADCECFGGLCACPYM
jgi:hypothetical protein